MLNKRFKIAKCKTSLKLATSRIKLLKNKKVIQISQMKKELAQLLESGQDRTARIRVEHVIREEKMVAAYDLIEIYCELIVARLPIIESQKTCPIDLKEAITSVIFAAPRCSDIPELADARKNFTAKYGKEFVSAAIELRPGCGVSHMMVEKLSAVAPDVQTKVKVLSAVAKEHNINWDATSFEEKESKPPDDLLNGPTNFEKESMINVDPPKIQTSNVHNVHNREESSNVPLDFSQQNKRFTLGAQNITTTDTGGVQMSAASTTHDDMRSSGMAPEMMNMRQSFHSNDNNSSSGRENWNMEFKDATSAAQAAAESAERASIAARAAAHLSRQYSTESQKSHIREERPPVSATSEFPGQQHFKYSNSSFMDRKPEIYQMGPSEHDISPKATDRFDVNSHGGTKMSSRSDSLKSRNDSVSESSLNRFHQADELSKSQENDFSSPEIRLKKESKAWLRSGGSESSKPAKVDYIAEEVIRKQPSIGSSQSHSSIIDDEHDVLTFNQQKVGKRTVDLGNHLRESTKTSSYDDARRQDETDSDSDSDGPRFDMGFEYDEGEAKAFFPSPGREPVRPLENEHIWSSRRNTSDSTNQLSAPSILTAKSVDPSENFDLSDGPYSESESEMAKSSLTGTKKFTSPRKHDLFPTVSEPAYVESSENVTSRKSRIELHDLIERGSSYNNNEDEDISLQSQQSSRVSLRHELKNSIDPQPVEDNTDSLTHSDDLGTRKEIKFGTLTGGLRNKGGLKYPPYTKSTVIDAPPSPKKSVEAEESPIKVNQTSKPSSFKSRSNQLENKHPSVSVSSSESDSDYYSNKFPVQASKIRSRFAPPDAFFNDDGIDSEGEAPPVPKVTPTSRVHMRSGQSQRTKGHVEPKDNTVFSSSIEVKRASIHSSINESPNEPQSYAENFTKDPKPILNLSKPSSTAAEQKSSRRSYSNKSLPELRTHTAHSEQEPFQTKPEPKISEQPPNPPKMIAESDKTEVPKTSNQRSETSLEANNVKKPSHVHPKLPDYDSLAARMQSLRANHH